MLRLPTCFRRGIVDLILVVYCVLDFCFFNTLLVCIICCHLVLDIKDFSKKKKNDLDFDTRLFNH